MIKNTNEGLRREIGVLGLSANIINIVIGAGIFVLPGIVAEGLGSAGLLAYLFCGFLITIIMLCFAEAGSKITITGGAYSYIEVAFGKYFGFLTTNLFIFGSSLMAAAAVANALANTLSYLFPVFSNPIFRAVFFLLIFSGLTIPNIRGVKQGITLVKITTIAKLTPLLLLIVLGSTKISLPNLTWASVPSIPDIGKISLILFFAFQGAENSFSISGEVRNSKKTIPKGILLSFFIILLFYISIQMVSQGILGDSLSSFKEAPLAEVAKRIMGPFGVTFMIIGATISMFGYLGGDILNMPRVLFGAARDNVIPVKVLSKVHPRYATPYISIILFATMGCFFSIVGEFKQLAILSSASSLLIYLGVALAVIKLRLRKETDVETFKIPGGFTIPIVAIIVIGWFLSNLTMNEKIGIVTFLGILSVVFLAIRFFKKKNLKDENFINKQ